MTIEIARLQFEMNAGWESSKIKKLAQIYVTCEIGHGSLAARAPQNLDIRIIWLAMFSHRNPPSEHAGFRCSTRRLRMLKGKSRTGRSRGCAIPFTNAPH
jgi:hypothetical protein